MTTITGNLSMSSKAVVVNERNVNSGIILKQRMLLSDVNHWHKVCVNNAEKLSRDAVLKAILDVVHPYDFIPVCYTVESEGVISFFVRNCKLAIEKLSKQGLVVMNPYAKNKFFKLTIILRFTTTKELIIDVQENIAQVLSKRYQSSSKIMNLDNFHKDPDLSEYCSFSQPKILYFILHLCKPFSVQHLRLSNNEIRILNSIESIWTMNSLTILDLRNNLIEKMSELNILKSMHITELYLDGNPLCDDYDEFSYVQAVKEVCPKIEKLDGILLGQNGFLAFRRNFLCNIEGRELIDQFLEHYFTLYDSPNRSLLEAMYLKESLFTITSQYLSGQTTTSTANLGSYKRISRNLKLISDLSKVNEFLIIGNSNIIQNLCNLPPTEHDPYTFTVDLMYYADKMAIVTITGVFREAAQTVLDVERLLGFTRTFVLRCASNGEYHIVNEQLHVTNATTVQQMKAFKVVRVLKPICLAIESPSTTNEKHEMEKTFKKMTNLNLNWSRKCLEERQYNLKKALILFVDLYKVDKIPQEAFT